MQELVSMGAEHCMYVYNKMRVPATERAAALAARSMGEVGMRLRISTSAVYAKPLCRLLALIMASLSQHDSLTTTHPRHHQRPFCILRARLPPRRTR